MTVSASLFDRGDDSAIGGAADWLTGLVSGTAASSLCIVAVAMLGLLMLTGRMPIRQGMQVVLGCFLLLGAGTIATGLQGLGGGIAGGESEPVPLVIERAAPPPLPPANYDPYAGASLRRRNIIEQER